MESDLGVIVIHSKSKTHHLSINILDIQVRAIFLQHRYINNYIIIYIMFITLSI